MPVARTGLPGASQASTSQTSAELLELTAELVAIPSVSHQEQEICEYVESRLRRLQWLSVERVGDNVVASTNLNRKHRLVLGGHLDTVPAPVAPARAPLPSVATASAPPASAQANPVAPRTSATPRTDVKVEGEWLWGTGATDMKGGLAVMLKLAQDIPQPQMDVTYVFYAREEVEQRYNGLREVFDSRPDLLEADVAVLGEPTDGILEGGCQGTLRVAVRTKGQRAHTARAWKGNNAVHALAPLLAKLQKYEPRRIDIEGCEYIEAMQAVSVSGGVAGNVVPDFAEVLVGHRFAPDKSSEEAEQFVKDFVAEAMLTDGPAEYSLELMDLAPACMPGLTHPVLSSLAELSGGQVRAKLGWTDVAFFGQRGIPAVNFGPGNPEWAHTSEERVSASGLSHCYEVLAKLLNSEWQ